MSETDKRSRKPRTTAPVPQSTDLTLGGTYFKASVKKARQRLMDRADEIIQKYFKMIDMAMAEGDFETANKAFQFLVEHMPKEDGEAIITESAAKPKQIESGPSGPIINIGVVVGGSSKPEVLKALPDVIDSIEI